MFGLDTRVLKILWTLLVCYTVYLLRDVIFLLVLSIIASFMLRPVVDFVDRHTGRGFSREMALALVYLVILAVIVLGGGFVGYYAFTEASALAVRLPDLMKAGTLESLPMPAALEPYKDEIRTQAREWIQTHGKAMLEAVTSASLKLLSALGSAVQMFLILMLSFLLLKGGHLFADGLLRVIPEAAHEKAHQFFQGMQEILSQWTRVMVVVALVTAIVYGIGFTLLGVPYSVLLALIAFPFEFIPLVGPPVAILLILAVAFFSGFKGFLWLGIFILVVRMAQDYGLQPYLMGSGAIELPSFVVIVGALAGETLAGIPGILLAVPAIAAMRLLYRVMNKSEAVTTG
jgi:predicted PurR-regulated permease PerM